VSELSTVAPAKAPSEPGTPIRSTSRQLTLPNRQCDSPEVNVVPISARCTLADDTAGENPLDRSTVLVVTPNAIPRAPSTNCPIRPARAKTSSRRMGQHYLEFRSTY
jgi:hypothetical protein